MPGWFYYAVGAAILYGLHQIFTKLAADRISDNYLRVAGFAGEYLFFCHLCDEVLPWRIKMDEAVNVQAEKLFDRSSFPTRSC